MSKAGFILTAALLFCLPNLSDSAHAQQSASLSEQQTPGARMTAPTAPATTSKTALATRFQDIKTQYAELKTVAEKYVPLRPDAPSELKVARLKIEAAMRSYDYVEFQTQRQRDQLNRLVTLSEAESQRLQNAMERLAKMSASISALMKQLNENGDALVASR